MYAFAASYVLLWALVVIEAIATVLLLRAVGGLYLGSRDAIDRDGLAIGSKAPDFEALTLDGRMVPSRDFGAAP